MKKSIFMTILCLIIVSCASTKQYKKLTDNEPLAVDKARIYLVRTGNFGGFVKFNAFLNELDNQVGVVGPKSFICFDVPVGEQKIIVKAETERFFTINAQAGKTYYLRLVPKMGMNYARVNFEMLSNEEGAAEVKKLKSPKMLYAE